MKAIVLFFSLLSFTIHISGQIIIRDPVKITTEQPKITQPAQTPLTQGIDIALRIDRVVDNSTFDENNFTIHYSIINSGTEKVDLAFRNFKIEGTFYNTDNSYAGAGGLTSTNQLGKAILNSGEVITSTLAVKQSGLLQNATYKYRLVIHTNNKYFQDLNGLNNTSEANIVNRAIPPGHYFLASAKVTIQTGNDNKEANNSKVKILLGPANHNDNIRFAKEITGELKVNSTTEFILDKQFQESPNIINPYNSLCFYKKRGLAIAIIYENTTWATDAWKINNVSVTLEFKDKTGNPYPHPAYASFTINFPASSGILGFRLGDDITSNAKQLRVMVLGTDQFLNPLPVLFQKDVARYLDVLNSPVRNAPVIICN